jgi:hypothetical protein
MFSAIVPNHAKHLPSQMFHGEPSKRDLICSTTTATEKSENTYLPRPDFIPSPNDVVRVRGKSYWDHVGNKMYRRFIAGATETYSGTSSKLGKTLVVSDIVEAVQKRNGRFVKRESKGGPWVEVDEVFARDKVGRSLRDGLSNMYRSSTKAKRQKRTQVNEKFNGDIDRLIQSNQSVSQMMDDLKLMVQQNGTQASDFSTLTLISRTNSDILEEIKKDASLVNQFQDATGAASNKNSVDREEYKG